MLVRFQIIWVEHGTHGIFFGRAVFIFPLEFQSHAFLVPGEGNVVVLVYPLICHLYVTKLEHTQQLVGDVRREIVADDDDDDE